MLSFFRKIDDFLYDARFGFQTISDYVAYYLDIDNITLARITYLVSFALLIVINKLSELPVYDLKYIISILGALSALGYTEFARLLDSNHTSLHPMRGFVTCLILRIFLLSLVILSVFIFSFDPTDLNLMYVGRFILIAMSYYFASCVILPPKDRFRLRPKALVH